MLAKTRELVEEVTRQLDAYDIAGACSTVAAFIDALNNWYIRRSRDRFWGSGEGAAADRDALDTLYTVLVTFTQVAAPLLPLLMDEIHLGLTSGPEASGSVASVHLTDWPDPATLPADPELVRDMDRVREVCSAALALRAEHGLRVRLPLARLTVAGKETSRLQPLVDLVREEVNVKEVELSDDLEAFGSFVLRPNGRVLGPKLGADTQVVIRAAKAGEWTTNDDGTVSVAGHTLVDDEFELALQAREGHATTALRGNDTVVDLDIEVTPELEAEGQARDLVRQVQDARRKEDLHVSDRIALRISLPDEMAAAVAPHHGYVAEQVLATSIEHVTGTLAHSGVLGGETISFEFDLAAAGSDRPG